MKHSTFYTSVLEGSRKRTESMKRKKKNQQKQWQMLVRLLNTVPEGTQMPWSWAQSETFTTKSCIWDGPSESRAFIKNHEIVKNNCLVGEFCLSSCYGLLGLHSLLLKWCKIRSLFSPLTWKGRYTWMGVLTSWGPGDTDSCPCIVLWLGLVIDEITVLMGEGVLARESLSHMKLSCSGCCVEMYY